MTGAATVMANNNRDLSNTLTEAMHQLNEKTKEAILVRVKKTTDAVLSLEEKMMNENRKLEKK